MTLGFKDDADARVEVAMQCHICDADVSNQLGGGLDHSVYRFTREPAKTRPFSLPPRQSSIHPLDLGLLLLLLEIILQPL